MLKENLLRQGVDLAFETNLLYLDVNNGRIGVKNATPNTELDITGSFKASGNITASGYANISGNITAGNISTLAGGNISNVNAIFANTFTSNVTTGTAPLTVTSTTQVANLNVAVAGSVINGNSNVVIPSANGNVNINAVGNTTLVITGTGANITGTANVSGNIYAGNVSAANFVGNINGNLVNGNSSVNVEANSSITITATSNTTMTVTSTGANITGTANVSGDGNIAGNVNLSNVNVANTTISSTLTNSNLYLAPNGTGILKVNANSAMTIPVGASGDRPGSPAAGMLRFSTGTKSLEFHDGTGWITIQSTTTSVTTDTFTGDGSTLNFTLSQSATTASVIVSINGTGQKPFTAYSVSGTTLTFTEAPSSTDVIEARVIATSTYISDVTDGTTSVLVSNTAPYARAVVQGTTRLEVNATNVILGNVGLVANVTGQSVNSSAVAIDQWATSGYTCAKYLVSVTNGTSRQMTELLLTSNSTNAYLANIGSINSGSALMTFTANIVSSNATLWGTGVGSGNTVKVSRQLIV
jgi:hypothetical protein